MQRYTEDTPAEIRNYDESSALAELKLIKRTELSTEGPRQNCDELLSCPELHAKYTRRSIDAHVNGDNDRVREHVRVRVRKFFSVHVTSHSQFHLHRSCGFY